MNKSAAFIRPLIITSLTVIGVLASLYLRCQTNGIILDKKTVKASYELRKDLESKGFGLLQELHQCFRILADTSNHKSIRKLRAAKEHSLTLFTNESGRKDPSSPFLGLYLNDEFKISTLRLNIGDYMDFIVKAFQSNEGIKICWLVPTMEDIESEDSLFVATNFKAPLYVEGGAKSSSGLFYQVYKTKIPVLEKASFGKNSLYEYEEICKYIELELRCLEKADSTYLDKPLDQKLFWLLALSEVGENDKKSCGNLRDDQGECPEGRIEVVAEELENIQNETSVDSTGTDVDGLNNGSVEALQPYVGVSTLDYFIPGKGFQHFQDLKYANSTKNRFPNWAIITGVCAGAGVSALIFKAQSGKLYQQHKQASILSVQDEKYDQANYRHKNFLIASGIMLGAWLTTDLIIFLKDRKQKKAYDAYTKEGNLGSLKITPSIINQSTKNALGISVNMRINLAEKH